MDCRKTSLHSKRQICADKNKELFEKENMQAQYNVLSYRITLFCHGYKVAIKIDETGHSGHRNIDY